MKEFNIWNFRMILYDKHSVNISLTKRYIKQVMIKINGSTMTKTLIYSTHRKSYSKRYTYNLSLISMRKYTINFH